jgi:hypothetical protein
MPRGIWIRNLFLRHDAALAFRQTQCRAKPFRIVGDDVRADVAQQIKQPALKRLLARAEYDFQFVASGRCVQAQVLTEPFAFLCRNDDS